MIKNIRHKGLRLLFEKDDASRLPPAQVGKIRRILARLQQAHQLNDADYPGAGLHPLKGDYAGFWAVSVTGNWRVIFKFEKGDAYDVDYLDYH